MCNKSQLLLKETIWALHRSVPLHSSAQPYRASPAICMQPTLSTTNTQPEHPARSGAGRRSLVRLHQHVGWEIEQPTEEVTLLPRNSATSKSSWNCSLSLRPAELLFLLMLQSCTARFPGKQATRWAKDKHAFSLLLAHIKQTEIKAWLNSSCMSYKPYINQHHIWFLWFCLQLQKGLPVSLHALLASWHAEGGSRRGELHLHALQTEGSARTELHLGEISKKGSGPLVPQSHKNLWKASLFASDTETTFIFTPCNWSIRTLPHGWLSCDTQHGPTAPPAASISSAVRQPLLCNATLNIHTDRGFLLLHRKPRTTGTSYLNLALKMRRQQATCRAGSETGGTHAETEAQHRCQAPSAAHPKAPALRSESPRAGPSHTMLQLHKNFPLLSLLHLEKHPTDLGFMTRLSCFIVNSSKGKIPRYKASETATCNF